MALPNMLTFKRRFAGKNGPLLASAFGVLITIAAGTTTAQAAITVMGSGLAQGCYKAAEFGGDTRDGINTCTLALNQEPLSVHDRASTYVNRGILRAPSNPRGALADYNEGIALAPHLAEAYVDRGAALLSLKRYRAALVAIDKGLALHVNRPQIAYYDRAVAHESLGDIRSAYFDYQHAVALSPNFTLAKQQLTRFKVIREPATHNS